MLTSFAILICSAHAATLAVQLAPENCAAVVSAAEFWVVAAVELAEALSAQQMDGRSSALANSVMQPAEALTPGEVDGDSSTSASGAAAPAEASPTRSTNGTSSKVIQVPLQPYLHLP